MAVRLAPVLSPIREDAPDSLAANLRSHGQIVNLGPLDAWLGMEGVSG